MKRHLITLAVAITLSSFIRATPQGSTVNVEPEQKPFFKKMADAGVFSRLDLAMNVGTTGIGVEISSPVTQWAALRIGFDWMPRIHSKLHFEMQNYTEDGKFTNSNFGKAQDLIKSLTGCEIDEKISMEVMPVNNSFRFLVDVYPFRNNRHWHFTAGFFIGKRQIGYARNTIDEMPSLVSIQMYNRLYEYVMNTDFMDTPLPLPGFDNIYLDPDVADNLKAKMESYGRLGVHMGNFKDGTPYIIEPAEGTDMLEAKAYANSFRPYLGFGYGGVSSKDKRWNVSFDLGILFWGGSPDIITYKGVNMTKDLENIPGKVGRYVDIVKSLKVFPVLNFRIAYTLL